VAVAVLAGALLVGASVRSSLRELALQRLGATDLAISTPTGFSQRLGSAMLVAAPDSVGATASLVALQGTVTHTDSRRVAARVQSTASRTHSAFHRTVPMELSGRDAALSESLATELGASAGTRWSCGSMVLPTFRSARCRAVVTMPVPVCA
jgi:creatinine amidohydrolase/Fe(II)-dependent formamide hydrolase-like protein